MNALRVGLWIKAGVGTMLMCVALLSGKAVKGDTNLMSRPSPSTIAQGGAVNVELRNATGDSGGAAVAGFETARISAPDLTVPRGAVTELVVMGEILNLPAFGVTVVLELVASEGATGAVVFTEAGPVDIVQLDDPWPGAGQFSAFDTNAIGSSPTQNGMADDNGTFIAAPLTFSGSLAVFPVWVAADAEGVWEIRLTAPATGSQWEGADVETFLKPGHLRLVAPGDGDGDGSIDLLNFTEFQRCFTGDVPTEVGRVAYSRAPELHCGVYDFDGDRDVDLDDYDLFRGLISGPGS